MAKKKTDKRVQGLLVVPGKPHTIESLVATVTKFKEANGISDYRIMKSSGNIVTQHSVSRFFRGYTIPSEAARVPNPTVPGRTSLAIALQIVQAMGLDLEVVVREAPDK